MMKSHPSVFGGAMIIAGTVIGAGMLANPTATAGIWFAGSLAVLLYTWFSMLSSGLMILEATTHYPQGANFDTIVGDLLGRGWSIITGLSVAFVLYLLTYAYIFTGGNLTAQALGAPLPVGQIVFTLVFAGCVWWSTFWVDRATSILIGGMVITFLWANGGLLGSAQSAILFDTLSNSHNGNYWIYLGTALPVCLASFGFHGNVSGLFDYFRGDAKKVARSLWLGTLIALVIYALWQFAVQGNLPRSQFGPVIAAQDNVAALLAALSQVAGSGLVKVLSFFSYMAIASSFLGVTLGLLDYLTDLFGFGRSRAGRSKAAALAFLPPLIACLLFPTGFVLAISYVGFAATVWTAFVPALLLHACRKKFGPGKGYRVYGGRWLMVWVFLFGLANVVAQVLSRANILPVFTG
ncbi:aromatic amino acid transporter [Eikenella glucosivorans]